MDCSKVQSMIEPFLNEELGDADKVGFINHVRSCKVCHDELEVYHVIYSVVDQLDNNAEDENIDYMATLERRLTLSEGSVKRRRMFRQIAVSIALVIVILVICLVLM